MILPKAAFERTHPIHSSNASRWQFFGDAYEGGDQYPYKANPLVSVISNQSQKSGAQTSSYQGTARYVWQHPLERMELYLHRLNRAVTVNPSAPVVDFYCGTIGKSENVMLTPGNLAEFVDDCDRRGRSLGQFMASCRTHATVFGHTFILVDSTRAGDQPIVTEADAQAAGIRPYLVEILPRDLLNWRLDDRGKPIEILFRTISQPPGSLADDTTERTSDGYQVEFRYWNRDVWQVYRKVNDAYVLDDEGVNKLGIVPLVPLYNLFQEPFLGESLLKDAAKYGQLLTNWCSHFDEAIEKQMFAQLVIRSRKEPSEVGVGVSIALHLNPDENEEASYLAPDTAPFDAGWSAFYRLLSMANWSMGLKSQPITEDGIQEPESGKAKQWNFYSADKILAAKALNEQEAVKQLMEIACQWAGLGEWNGSIRYSENYDLSTLEDEIATLLSLQSVNAPPAMKRELLRRVKAKALPYLPEEVDEEIEKEIDKWGKPAPAPMQMFGAPASADETERDDSGPENDSEEMDLEEEEDQQESTRTRRGGAGEPNTRRKQRARGNRNRREES